MASTEASQPSQPDPAPGQPGAEVETPASPGVSDTLAALREAAAAKDAPSATIKALVGALVGQGDADSLREAERLMSTLQGRPDVSERWLSLTRAALAEAAGADAEVETHARAALAATLDALPVEVGTCHVSDDLGGVDARESISFRPDDYVSVALQARCFGVAARPDGRWDYRLELSARLLDEQGKAVSGFAPPAAEYRPGFASCAPLDHPGDRWTWFVFFIEQRLPMDLKAGNYVLEITLKDRTGKERLGDVSRRLDLRVR
ncbi:MAG: hypothetical protein IT463_05945 [Planctomycetes bacterium]|nr:hypothetical protein [Planctomycetota bacterium]